MKNKQSFIISALCAVSFISSSIIILTGRLHASLNLCILAYVLASICLFSIIAMPESSAYVSRRPTASLASEVQCPGSSASYMVPLLAFLVIVVFCAAFLIPNFLRARAQGQLGACKSNLKNMGEAVEQYGLDNGGCYPPALSCLTQKYLVAIPTCPSANKPVYIYDTDASHKIYTVYCKGKNHVQFNDPNLPEYDSIQGLIESY